MSKGYIVRIDPQRCKGCELCVVFCPTQVLGMSKGFNLQGAHFSKVIQQEACIGCRQCALICPDAAIEIDREQRSGEKPDKKEG